MTDLRTRFRTLDAAPVPELWPEVKRRATEITSLDAAVGRPVWRGARRRGSAGVSWRVVLAVAILVAAVLAVAGPGGFFNDVAPPPSPTPTSSATLEPSAEASPASTVSPLGWIAFIRNVPSESFSRDELWLVRVDGSDAHALIPGFGRHQSHPVWSPDGGRLVFSDRPAATGGGDELYWTDLAGTAPVLVDPTCTDPCGTGDPAFSRDGTRLLFGRDGVLVVMDLATGQLTSLGIEGGGSRWSPDDSQLVFTRGEMGGRLGKDVIATRVFVANSDGTGLRAVTSADLAAGSPDWLPDGSGIVFSTREVPLHFALFGTGDIFTIRPDGTGQVPLTSGGVSREPRVTEDGRIRFVRNLDGEDELWAMDVDGLNAAPVELPTVIPQPDTTTIGDIAWGSQP